MEDYLVWSFDCPAMKAIAEGQDMWRHENKAAIDGHIKGRGADPSVGLYWLSQGVGEAIPG